MLYMLHSVLGHRAFNAIDVRGVGQLDGTASLFNTFFRQAQPLLDIFVGAVYYIPSFCNPTGGGSQTMVSVVTRSMRYINDAHSSKHAHYCTAITVSSHTYWPNIRTSSEKQNNLG